MLLESSLPDPTALSGVDARPQAADSSGSDSATPLDFPYNVTPALYPNPTYLTSATNTSGVQVFSLSNTQSMFGMVNASTDVNGSAIWFESGEYSPSLAKGIFLNSCGETCPTLPLSWSTPIRIANLSGPVTADAATSLGSTVLVAATSSGTTQVYSSASLGASWAAFGSAVTGNVRALSVSPTEVLLETSTSTSVRLVSDSFTGSAIGTVVESVSGSSTVSSASAAMVASSTGYTEVAAYSVTGTNELEVTTSTTGGATFAAPTKIGSFGSQGPSPLLDQVGDTDLTPPDVTAGQVAMAASPSGLLLAYTSENLSGATELLTMSSANQGSSWTTPEPVGPVTGTIDNLTLAPSPAGLVYAAWRDPDAGSGGIDQATLMGNGYPVVEPTALPGLDQSGSIEPEGPSIAVDAYQRPLIAWSAGPSNPMSGTFVSGGFLSSSRAATLVNTIVDDPLVPANFAGSATQGTVTSFVDNVTSLTSKITKDIGSSKLCAAQNLTTLDLYANVTHVPLEISNASTVCASNLSPSYATSPILSEVGLDAPNTYLATYVDWLLQSEAEPLPSSPLENLTSVPLFASTVPSGSSGSASLLGSTEKVSISPSIYSPTSAELAVTTNALPANVSKLTTTETFIRCVETGDSAQEVDFEGGTLSKTTTQASVDSGATDTLATGTTSYPSTVWLTHLTPDATHSYTVDFSATYSGSTGFYEPTCLSNGDGDVEDWSSTMTTKVSGSVTTTLSFTGDGEFVKIKVAAGSDNASISFPWSTTMPAIAHGELLDTSTDVAVTASTSTYATSGALPSVYGSWTEPLGDAYEATLTAQSRPGTTPNDQTPAYAEVAGLSSPAENETTTCQIALSRPGFSVWGLQVGNETATSAQVTFETNASDSLGWLSLDGSDWSGYSVEDVQGSEPSSNGTVVFVIEADGLEPWSYYRITYGVSFGSGCSSDSVSYTTSQLVQTSPEFAVWERDLPYDSISQTGGGAQIGWSVPQWFAAQAPTFELASISYTDLTAKGSSVVLNLTSPPVTDPTDSDNYVLNLSLTNINDTYSVTVDLFYWSSGSNWTNATGATEFIYEHDTTGDGLTDLEKEDGWTVSYTTDLDINTTEKVTADPNAYATNGLVSDYLEKLYGLNPNTVDTAGSRMLDTWNLTFELGSNWTIPDAGDFDILNESATYRPFNTTVNAAPGVSEPGHPLDPAPYRWANITATPGGGLYSGDGSVNASEILWNYSALETFVNLPAVQSAVWFDTHIDPDGGGLRAVLGKWNGKTTLTIWGKLSWGADPLQASSLGYGEPDGARIDPLGKVGLALTISNLYVTGLDTGQGYAASIGAYYGSTTYPLDLELSNYSATVGLGVGTSNGAGSGKEAKFARLSGYRVILPVSQTNQTETVQLQIFANLSNTSTLTAIPFEYNSSSSTLYFEENITYDMVAGLPMYENFTSPANPSTVYDSESGHDLNGTLDLSLQSYLEGQKATTYLWLPNTTSTVNGLPAGLERYTGEQSFDLVVVNVSKSYLQSVPIPDPSGGTYRVLPTEGLNNFLIPREQFLNSPFAAAVLLGKDFPYPASDPIPPILSAAPFSQSALTEEFGTSSGWMFELEAYWQNRSILPGTAVNFTQAELGTANDSPLQVSILGVTTAPANNTGGLASDQGIYQDASVSAPPALQALVTLNITSNATLNLLLAALLDNTTGTPTGVNGSFQDVTSYEGSLGLYSSVQSALANAVINNEGLFDSPTYSAPANRGSNAWGAFWNEAVAVLTNPAGTIVSLIETGLGVVEAAGVYATQLWHRAQSLGGVILDRTASSLTSLGDAVVAALSLAMEYLVEKASQLLSLVLDPVASAVRSTISGWFSSWFTVSNAVDTFYEAASGQRQTDRSTAVALMAPTIQPMLLAMGIVAAAIVTVSTLLGPFDFASGLIGGVILSVAVTAFGVSLPGTRESGTDPLLDATSLTYGYVSSLTELFFNETESPLNSSAGLAIAVPDGDPWDALGAIAGLVGGLVVIYTAGADAYGSGLGYGVLAAMMIGCILAFFGIGLAFDTALSLGNLPPPSSNQTVREEYQADSGIAAVAAVVAATGLIVCAATAKLGGADVLLSSVVSGVVSAAVLGFSFLTIESNHSKEGTYP